ncbi:hypothetical protein [Cellulophaga baltica]|uniref:hypothetical protein n=1 Tax=Cellulophaga baltica TaxID=76594 RepID=UPI0024953F8B|nr:hypothetical protein [Cellulophaga baltica]
MKNMYLNQSSRNPNKPLFIGLLLGIGCIAFGCYLYSDLAAWENSNEEMHLPAFLWGVYDHTGKIGITGLFSGIGLMSIIYGYKKTSAYKRLIKATKKQR